MKDNLSSTLLAMTSARESSIDTEPLAAYFLEPLTAMHLESQRSLRPTTIPIKSKSNPDTGAEPPSPNVASA